MKTIRLGLRGISLITGLASLTLIGCGRPLESFQVRLRTQAPQSARDVGVLAYGANEEDVATLLGRHSNARFRALNEQAGYFEIFGLSAGEVQNELPLAEVSPNEFMPAEMPNKAWTKLSEAAVEPMADLDQCLDGDQAPVAQIEVQAPPTDLANATVQLNTVIRLSGARSQNKAFPGQSLKMAWVVLSPQGAKVPEQVISGPQLTATLDAMGGFGVALVVQDSRHVCGLDTLAFQVTANREYLGPNKGQLDKIDLSPMTHLARLHAPEGWKISQGSGQIIAFVDTGVNFNHPALRDNILVNAKEIPRNGIDDDHNGFIDDVVGWDFQYSDASPFDDLGHGSHVAGLAASSLMGMAKQAKILPIKALGAFGGDLGSITAGIHYAVDRGAKIINMSLGNYAESAPPEMVRAMQYAESHGVLVVAAAGNGDPETKRGVDTDKLPNFPSALPNGNILAVAAAGAGPSLAAYSNYGLKTVDVAAPGGEGEDPLISTFLENPAGSLFVGMSGTSMATPVVSGLAAQVWALNPRFTAAQVKAAILTYSISVPDLKSSLASGRIVDDLAVLQGIKAKLPASSLGVSPGKTTPAIPQRN